MAAFRDLPVAVSVSLTCAFVTTAPDWSVIVPVTVPEAVDCGQEGAVLSTTRTRRENDRLEPDIFELHAMTAVAD